VKDESPKIPQDPLFTYSHFKYAHINSRIPDIHTFMSTYIQSNKHTYRHTDIQTYTQTYIHTSICIIQAYTHSCLHTYNHTNIHTNIHTNTQIYIYTSICIIHAYTHSQVPSRFLQFTVHQTAVCRCIVCTYIHTNKFFTYVYKYLQTCMHTTTHIYQNSNSH